MDISLPQDIINLIAVESSTPPELIKIYLRYGVPLGWIYDYLLAEYRDFLGLFSGNYGVFVPIDLNQIAKNYQRENAFAKRRDIQAEYLWRVDERCRRLQPLLMESLRINRLPLDKVAFILDAYFSETSQSTGEMEKNYSFLLELGMPPTISHLQYFLMVPERTSVVEEILDRLPEVTLSQVLQPFQDATFLKAANKLSEIYVIAQRVKEEMNCW